MKIRTIIENRLFTWRCAYGGVILAFQVMKEMQESAESAMDNWTDEEIDEYLRRYGVGDKTCAHIYDCDCDTIAAELAGQDN